LKKDIPKKVAVIQNSTFAEIFNRALEKRPFCNISKVSKENVENVVKAPIIPVINKALYIGDIFCSKYRNRNR